MLIKLNKNGKIDENILKIQKEMCLQKVKCIESMYRDEIREIDQELQKIAVEKAKQNIGKCFKFKNSYSLPSTENDYWFEYYKIVDIGTEVYTDNEKGYFYKIINVSKDCRGFIKIVTETDNICYARFESSNYIEIDACEFDKQLKSFVNEITKK